MTGKPEAEAAVWFAQLGDDARNPQGHRGLAAWRAERPANAAALAEMDALWSDLEHVAALSFIGERQQHRLETGEPRAKAQATRRTRALSGRVWRAAAGGATALAAVILLFFASSLVSAPVTFETAVGGQRIASLPDASRVILNTDSKVAARFTANERLVRLDRGEALFEVSRDPSRPFVVRTHLGKVTALGTRFVVRDRGEVVEVTLLEGSVLVDPERDGQASFIMSPGQRVRIGITGSTSVDKPSLGAVTAWRQGGLVLQDMSALAAAREMNRYGRKRIVLDPVDVANCRVSGVFRVADTERFAHILARICGLQLERRADSYLIRP